MKDLLSRDDLVAMLAARIKNTAEKQPGFTLTYHKVAAYLIDSGTVTADSMFSMPPSTIPKKKIKKAEAQ